jgi:hypothetical protein
MPASAGHEPQVDSAGRQIDSTLIPERACAQATAYWAARRDERPTMKESSRTDRFHGNMKGRFADMNRPPQGENWIWTTATMLESPAWRAMPGHAVKVVMRIALEHLKHGGIENGDLPTTYNDFVRFGVRRARIREAIMIAIHLGWIERVSVGETPWHGNIREPGKFALTWLPKRDGTQASNKWTRFTTMAEARAAVLHARAICERVRKLPRFFNRQVGKKSRNRKRTNVDKQLQNSSTAVGT